MIWTLRKTQNNNQDKLYLGFLYLIENFYWIVLRKDMLRLWRDTYTDRQRSHNPTQTLTSKKVSRTLYLKMLNFKHNMIKSKKRIKKYINCQNI